METSNRHSWKQAVHERYYELKSMGEAFFPYVVFKDIIAITVVISALVYLSIYYPPPMEGLADPTEKNYNPRPEWYFLFLFQLLKYVPPQYERIAVLGIPAVAVLILFFLPMIGRHINRHPLDRPIVTSLGIIGIASVIYLGYQGYRSPLTNVFIEKDVQVVHGQRIYFEKVRCQNCHSINGKGGILGPALDLVSSRRDKKWMAEHFINPQSVSPGTGMPNFGLLPDEVDALVVYMASLGGGTFTAKALELFKEHCATCHKIGDIGKDVASDLSEVGRRKEQGWIAKYIENPEKVDPKASMPAFGDSLAKDQIEDLSKFLSAQRGSVKKPK